MVLFVERINLSVAGAISLLVLARLTPLAMRHTAMWKMQHVGKISISLVICTRTAILSTD